MIRLPSDFNELLKLFHSEQIEYLLVGGYAVAYHGHSRFTNDMDLWISPEPENAARVVRALQEFGFSAGSLSREVFQRPN